MVHPAGGPDGAAKVPHLPGAARRGALAGASGVPRRGGPASDGVGADGAAVRR